MKESMSVMPAATSGAVPELDDLLGELSRTLWKQRGLIELLQYRLEVQQLILEALREHRLQTALEEVEAAMEDIRRSERTRDAVVRQCAQRLGLDPSASLGDIRVRAEEPWASMLAEHQDALLTLVAGTERLAATNRELAQRGAKETQSVLDAVTGSVTTNAYGPSTGRGLARPTLVDRRA
jgi:hypothetical protein